MPAQSDFKLAVDKNNQATELALLRVCGTVQKNPHMRAFWASTISFFLAFLGWFALAPLGLEVATSMGVCENQLYSPEDNPKRAAYLKYKSLATGDEYCKYGKNDDVNPTDCNPVPDMFAGAADEMQYRPEVLAKCVCTTGTECNAMIANAGVAAVASTIFVRIALGTLLERFGPVNVQSGLMTFGAFWVAMAAAISAPWNYTLIRFFIGCAGAGWVQVSGEANEYHTLPWCGGKFHNDIQELLQIRCSARIRLFSNRNLFPPLRMIASDRSKCVCWWAACGLIVPLRFCNWRWVFGLFSRKLLLRVFPKNCCQIQLFTSSTWHPLHLLHHLHHTHTLYIIYIIYINFIYITRTRQEIDPSSDRLGTESRKCKTKKAKEVGESSTRYPSE